MLEKNSRELLATQTLGFYHTTKIALDAKEATETEKRIVEETKHLAKRKEELKRIMMRKKGLEALREKKDHEYRTEEARRTQKSLDDLYSLRRERRN
jgi:flagellar biosynthesis chaperone FliJ